jgi:hypothetical protein
MTPTYKATSPRKLKRVPSRLKFKGVLLIENNNLRIREEEAGRLKLWCEGERKERSECSLSDKRARECLGEFGV